MNQSVTDKGVYRTAPATPGLLNTALFPDLNLDLPIGVVPSERLCYQRGYPVYLADPGEARGCSTNTFVIN